MSDDPNWHWNGSKWLWWNGSTWVEAEPLQSEDNHGTAGGPVAAPAEDQEEVETEFGRADIDAAAAVMGSKFGVKRELRQLASQLQEGETVEVLTSGEWHGSGLLALTDRRLIFYVYRMTKKSTMDFPVHQISSIEWVSGMTFGKIKIFANGNKTEIKSVNKASGAAITDEIRRRIAVQHQQVSAPATAAIADQPDPADQLRKLAELHDAGILTDDEFSAKKAEILRRM